jgi:hypothetical protein
MSRLTPSSVLSKETGSSMRYGTVCQSMKNHGSIGSTATYLRNGLIPLSSRKCCKSRVHLAQKFKTMKVRTTLKLATGLTTLHTELKRCRHERKLSGGNVFGGTPDAQLGLEVRLQSVDASAWRQKLSFRTSSFFSSQPSRFYGVIPTQLRMLRLSGFF